MEGWTQFRPECFQFLDLDQGSPAAEVQVDLSFRIRSHRGWQIKGGRIGGDAGIVLEAGLGAPGPILQLFKPHRCRCAHGRIEGHLPGAIQEIHRPARHAHVHLEGIKGIAML